VIAQEPEITINGVKLTEGQSLVLRVAITHFRSELFDGTLSKDDLGDIHAGYTQNSLDILKIMGVV
jgi:hypothetical protein